MKQALLPHAPGGQKHNLYFRTSDHFKTSWLNRCFSLCLRFSIAVRQPVLEPCSFDSAPSLCVFGGAGDGLHLDGAGAGAADRRLQQRRQDGREQSTRQKAGGLEVQHCRAISRSGLDYYYKLNVTVLLHVVLSRLINTLCYFNLSYIKTFH